MFSPACWDSELWQITSRLLDKRQAHANNSTNGLDVAVCRGLWLLQHFLRLSIIILNAYIFNLTLCALCNFSRTNCMFLVCFCLLKLRLVMICTLILWILILIPRVSRSTELLYLKYEHNDVIDKASSCTQWKLLFSTMVRWLKIPYRLNLMTDLDVNVNRCLVSKER